MKNKEYKIKVVRHHYIEDKELADIEIFYKKKLAIRFSNWANKAESHLVGFIKGMVFLLGPKYEIWYYNQTDRERN